MITLSLDLETFSSVDLITSGVYKYAEAADFEILLFAYAWDDEPVQLVDLASGEKLPEELENALQNAEILKSAFNANFERTCLEAQNGLGQRMLPQEWDCTMVRALSHGLPGSLDSVARVLGLPEQKDRVGKSLISYFCKPCAATRTNHGRTRNLPRHDPEKWELFKGYCKQDVEVERAIRKALPHPQPASERRLWALDQEINDRGVPIDRMLVEQAIRCDTLAREKLTSEAIALTGLDNPNSVQQLTGWLSEAEGVAIEKLTKATVPDLIKAANSAQTRRVLEIRQELSKTSVKKYAAMAAAVCEDDRVRGLLQFYGARTGRWAGRLLQPQNFPRILLPEKSLSLARRLLREGEFERLEILFGNVPDTLSQLIRTAFIARDGHRLVVCDLSAIEARVLAWAAGETWALEEFRGAGKIYEATAARMYGIPKEEIKKNSPERQKGKTATLGCGYGGGVGALKKMGAERDGLTEEEMQAVVTSWRKANPNIVAFWRQMESAAIEAVENRKKVNVNNGISFDARDGALYMGLPSGRELTYPRPAMAEHPKNGRQALSFEGVNSLTRKWERQYTYSGKLVENATQGIARDVMAAGMVAATDAGYEVILTVHDELVCEVREGKGSAAELVTLMTKALPWAPGLPLAAEGAESRYYCK